MGFKELLGLKGNSLFVVPLLQRNCLQLYLILLVFLQYGLPMPVALLRADNNLPPWRPGLKEVISFKISFLVVHKPLLCLFSVINSYICSFSI